MSSVAKQGRFRKRSAVLLSIALLLVLLANELCIAQIATVRPDRAAPGMNVVVELLTPNASFRPFGYDSLNSGNAITLVHPSDSLRVMLGPSLVSWEGRVLQLPLFISPSASLGPVPIAVFDSVTDAADTFIFEIDSTQHLGAINNTRTFAASTSVFSNNNVLVVDSLIVTNAALEFSIENPDTTAINPRLLPVTILSKGPVRLTNATITVNADSLDGGPGGGGGGHGFGGPDGGIGGAGFTGGGSCPADTIGSEGSGGYSDIMAGGPSITGIAGGGSSTEDQGGGGGTGSPYGISGSAGVGNVASVAGGFGGGSGGGEEANPFVINTLIEDGGGGGGFGTEGIGGGQSSGAEMNGGSANGGRFLVPFAGGSGGGAGNSNELGDGDHRASGGGGGGAIEIIAFDSIVLHNSLIEARGDSGQSGIKIAAGGGGGSGGGIYLASTSAIVSTAVPVNVLGGAAGRPAADSIGYAGGNGGLGRVRIDGVANFTAPAFYTSVWVAGLSLRLSRATIRNDSMQLSGIDPDRSNLLDAVRIFYRTPHSAWHSSDTVRDSTGAWSKWVPLLHDSLLYVVAMAEVSTPAQGLNNEPIYEPSWLLSSAAIARLTHPATPDFVVLDSLNFGTVRQGHCKTLALVLSNKGSAPLSVTPNAVTGSQSFSFTPDTTLTIAPYRSDTIQVTFCADSLGSAFANLTFLSNDSGNSPHVVALFGIGLNRNDSLSIVPSTLNFGPVRIGNCVNDTVLLRSLGLDTLYLDSSHWQRGPFSWNLVPPDTALPHNTTAKLVVTFCPTDSGTVFAVLMLDDREDSLTVRGQGILHRASVASTQNVGTFCRGEGVVFFDTITNLGNDTISIVSLSIDSQRTTLGLVLQPKTFTSIPVSFQENRRGAIQDTIRFQLGDTSLTSVLAFQVFGPILDVPSHLSFPFQCLGNRASDSLAMTNAGPDTLLLSNFNVADTDFLIEDSIEILAPAQQFSLRLQFLSGDTVWHFDTLHFIAADHGCDSMFAIAIEARTIDSGLAAAAIDFGTVPVDSCRTDSTLVQNPCGPAVIVDSVFFTHKEFQWVTSGATTVPSDSSAFFVFRYCPQSDTTALSDTAVLVRAGQALLRVPLLGRASAIGFPSVYFTVSSETVQAGSIATTTIHIDSSSIAGEYSIRGMIWFDPAVVAPEAPVGFPIAAVRTAPDSVAWNATLNSSSSPSVIESIAWRALVGPANRTAIHFSLTADKPLDVHSSDGSITVTDCTGLNGAFAGAGTYAISPPTPNPSSDEATVTVTFGYDGYAEAGLYDLTGREVEPVLSQPMPVGTSAIPVPLHSVPSGKYFFVVHSLGWEASEPVVIAH